MRTPRFLTWAGVTCLLCTSSVLGAIPTKSLRDLDRALEASDGAAITIATNRIVSGSLTERDVDALQSKAQTLGDAGYRDAAGALLVRAAELLGDAVSEADRERVIDIAQALRGLNLRTTASSVASRGIKVTGKMSDSALNAASYQLQGDIAYETGDFDGADEAYAQSEAAATTTEARVDLLSKRIKLAAIGASNADLRALLNRFQAESAGLSSTEARAKAQLNVAAALLSGQGTAYLPDALLFLEQSKATAGQAASDGMALDVAIVQGQISMRTGAFDEALKSARSALLSGGSAASAGQTYRLYWQVAKSLKAKGDLQGALANYERAINKLDQVRGVLLQSSTLVFRERVLPVYQQYLDVLLALADQSQGNESQWLTKVQQTLETLNASEILDYFDDNCVLPSNVMSLSDVRGDTAVLYGVTVSERPMTLVRTASGIYRFDSGISGQTLASQAAQFRDTITNPVSSLANYQAQGQRLYQALFAKADELLKEEGIQRVISIPSGYLRLIPMAALHDGEDFLLNRYEWVTTLGLQLTDASPFNERGADAFVGGVSDAVQGFIALPGVEVELARLGSALDSQPLLNQSFSVDQVTQQLAEGEYSIVHLATHGYFDGDHANSFLLAHDDKITLDRLQATVGARKYSGAPLDLLVLSACETAKGDERAALGLAGVSLKAGARSTVASLWPIADEATAMLMERFYTALRQGETKSRALQLAQQSLLSDPEWAHPNYWSPYLLIGNWQ